MYQDIYNCMCQNTKKIRFIIHYVKFTAQLLLEIRFPKGEPTWGGKWLIHDTKHHKVKEPHKKSQAGPLATQVLLKIKQAHSWISCPHWILWSSAEIKTS